MRTVPMLAVAAAAAALLAACSASAPAPKSSEAAAPEYLFVQEGTSGAFTAGDDDYFDLALTGVEPRTVYFADRPAADAGSMTTDEFLASFSWTPTPPNAAVVLRDGDDDSDTIAVTIDQPAYDAAAGTLHYRAKLLAKVEGTRLSSFGGDLDTSLPGTFNQVALFIDDGGLPECGPAGLALDSQLLRPDGSTQSAALAAPGEPVRAGSGRTSTLATLSQGKATGAIELRTASTALTVTPETCVITPSGPLPAADLQPGDRIMTANGPDSVMSATVAANPLQVVFLTPTGGTGPAGWNALFANGIEFFAAPSDN
jgi:hypothetical protein